MSHFTDLPVELITIIARELPQPSELNALARVNRTCYGVVNPILYTAPKNSRGGWPLKWAAYKGYVGTLRNALAGGYDPEMALNNLFMRPAMDIIMSRPVGPKQPSQDPEQEWEPKAGDGDDTTSHVIRPSHLRTIPSRWDSPDTFDSFGSPDDDDSDLSLADWDVYGDAYEIGDPFEEYYDDDDDEYSGFYGFDPSQEWHERDSYKVISIAAMCGHKDIIQVLLDHGANIDTPTTSLCTCQRAFSYTHLTIFEDDLPYDRPGWTPLHLAICNSQTETAKFLLSKGAKITMETKSGRSTMTALHHAAAFGQTDLVRYLLDKEFVKDVDEHDEVGLTSLYYAYANGRWESTIPFLLERGANINFRIGTRGPSRYRMRESPTILYEACHYGYFEEAMKLIDLGANVEKGHGTPNTALFTPLHACCRPPEKFPTVSGVVLAKVPNRVRGSDEIESSRRRLIAKLILKGAGTDALSGDGSTALHYAAEHRILSAIKSLLAAGADVKLRNKGGFTPLMEACRPRPHNPLTYYPPIDPLDVVEEFLKFGCNIDEVDSHEGNPALHLACQFSKGPDGMRDRIVRLLLDRGADQHARNKAGKTAFQVAFESRSLSLCNTLLCTRDKIVPLTRDELHRLADLIACDHFDRHGDSVALEFLLDIDIKRYLHSEPTTLMRFVSGKSFFLTGDFLQKGIPSMNDSQHMTILQRAMTEGGWGVAKMLAAGLSPQMFDRHAREMLLKVARLSELDYSSKNFLTHLLETGVDIHSTPTSGSGKTPLQVAIDCDNTDAIALMLDKYPLRNDSRAPKGLYLHAAIHAYHEHRHPRKKTLSLLLRSGADLHEVDENDDTPLSLFLRSILEFPTWVVQSTNIDGFLNSRIWYLWKKDMDVNRKNKQGKSVIDYLQDLGAYQEPHDHQDHVAVEIRQYLKIESDENGTKRLKFLKPPTFATHPKSPTVRSLQELLIAEQQEI